MTTLPTFITDLFTMIGDAIAIFNTEPLNYFVYLGLAAASIGIAKGLIPRKKAK